MSHVKLNGAFFIKWRYFAAFIVFRNTVTVMSTTAAHENRFTLNIFGVSAAIIPIIETVKSISKKKTLYNELSMDSEQAGPAGWLTQKRLYI